MKIIKGKLDKAQKVIVYGPEGIGKSTFASMFPNPLFIDTEGSTAKLDIARTEAPNNWNVLLSQIDYVIKNPNICSTLVIDTADWAEKLATRNICSSRNKKSIGDFGYGAGYTYLEEHFQVMLNKLSQLIDRDIHVVITAHSKITKFEQPDELGAYDRWELKLEKKTAGLLKEWADMVLFANYKTKVVETDGGKGKNKAKGGQRVMYTSHTPAWDAKNRDGLVMELDFDYKQIAHLFKERVQEEPIKEEQLEFIKEKIQEEPNVVREVLKKNEVQNVNVISEELAQKIINEITELMMK